jgi:hypothetical protein
LGARGVPDGTIVGAEGKQLSINIISAPPGQPSPGRLLIVAYAYFCAPVFQPGQGSAHAKLFIGNVVLDISRILRHQFGFNCIEVQQIGVVKARIALVQGNNYVVRKIWVMGEYPSLELPPESGPAPAIR